MKLRPHHLLCLQKYTGNGYDAAFAANMDELIRRLTADPDTTVQLTAGRDDVCAACPHMLDDICDSEEKVDRMDRGVLAACDRSFGQIDSWRALARAAREQVLETEGFRQVCGDCQWIELCRNTQRGWLYGKEE